MIPRHGRKDLTVDRNPAERWEVDPRVCHERPPNCLLGELRVKERHTRMGAGVLLGQLKGTVGVDPAMCYTYLHRKGHGRSWEIAGEHGDQGDWGGLEWVRLRRIRIEEWVMAWMCECGGMLLDLGEEEQEGGKRCCYCWQMNG